MSLSLSNKISEFIKSDENKAKISSHQRMIVLAEKIYGRRKDLGLSQPELAKRAGTSQRIISQLEDASYASKQGVGDEMYNKLSDALKIDREYLVSYKIDRRTFELFNFIGKKLNGKWDIMQFMKIPYFIDLQANRDRGFQLSNLSYIRYEYGPFDRNIYTYRNLFEQREYNVTYSYIADFIEDIENVLKSLPIKNGNKLKSLSYETAPMKKIGATVGGKEGWLEKLDLSA